MRSPFCSSLAEGYTAYGISRRLAISPRTVQKHLEHIYRKLAVSDRLSAVQVAVELGLVDIDRRSETRGARNRFSPNSPYREDRASRE